MLLFKKSKDVTSRYEGVWNSSRVGVIDRMTISLTTLHSRSRIQRKRPTCKISKNQISKGLRLQVQELTHHLETLHEQTTSERSVSWGVFSKLERLVIAFVFLRFEKDSWGGWRPHT